MERPDNRNSRRPVSSETRRGSATRLDVESRVLQTVQSKLLRQDFFEEFCCEFRERDEPTADETTLRPERREARAEQDRGPSQEAARPDAGRRGADQRGQGK